MDYLILMKLCKADSLFYETFSCATSINHKTQKKYVLYIQDKAGILMTFKVTLKY